MLESPPLGQVSAEEERGFRRGERKFCFLNGHGLPTDEMGKRLKDGSVSSCQRWWWLAKDFIFAVFWEGDGSRTPGLNV